MFAVPLFFTRDGRAFGDRALDGLSGCYPNTGYIGFPLAFLAYGPPSGPGATIAAVLTTCVLFGLAIALLEWDRHRGHAFGATVMKVGTSLVRNPIVIAPILAVPVTAGWLEMPAAADRVIKLLAASAGPCALVAHGLFLARDDPSNARPWAAATRPRPLALVSLKLLVQPAHHRAARGVRVRVDGPGCAARRHPERAADGYRRLHACRRLPARSRGDVHHHHAVDDPVRADALALPRDPAAYPLAGGDVLPCEGQAVLDVLDRPQST